MKKFSLSEAKPYAAAKHFNMTAMRLQGKEETGIQKFWVGMSYFLPGGGAEWAYEDNPNEKVYIVLDGEITVKNKEQEITPERTNNHKHVASNIWRNRLPNTDY